MKQVREFMDQTEAVMAKDYLLVHGIESELRGAKDYSTHVMGGTQGRYFLCVDEGDFNKAHELLTRSNLKVASQIEHPTEISEVALKKAVMFAFIAMILLPVLGNWISFREARKYARITKDSTKKWIWLVVISWLQVPGIVIAWILLKTLMSATRVVEISE